MAWYLLQMHYESNENDGDFTINEVSNSKYMIASYMYHNVMVCFHMCSQTTNTSYLAQIDLNNDYE